MSRRSLLIPVIAFCLFACVQAPTTAPPDPADPFAALEELTRELEAAVEMAREAEPASRPGGDAEGALHVVRQLLRAIDEELAWADTEHPYFVRQDTRFAKLALGNPDNLYVVARVDDDASYRIRGARGTTADFAIQLYQGYPGVGRPFAAKGSLDLMQLVVDDAGRFEVTVSSERPAEAANWIRMLPGTRRILVRYTYSDWSHESAGELSIERVGTVGTRATPPDSATVANRLRAASFYLIDSIKGYLATTDAIHAPMPANTLHPLRETGAGGLTGQYLTNGHYAIDDDHALIVSTRPSDARYQGFQIGTWWFEALDYANRTTSFSTDQAHLGSDGVYRFVVSTRDPGVPNWLDAEGTPEGLMLLRWQGAGKLGPEHEPEAVLVPFDEILDHFPKDVPRMDAEARRQQISQRKNAIDRRFGVAAR